MTHYRLADQSRRPSTLEGSFTDLVADAVESFDVDEFSRRDVEGALRVYDKPSGRWVWISEKRRKQVADHLSRWVGTGYLSARRSYVNER